MTLTPLPQQTLVLKNPKNIKIEEYEISRVLGEGSFGRVKLVKNIQTKQYYVFKQLKKNEIIRSKQVDHLKNEVFILNSFDYSFYVKAYGIAQDSKFLYIMMEFIQGGELFTYLRTVGKFTPSQACFYASQITLMFEYMHSFNVVYRDLKPENLMIDIQGYLKLTDFGFAKIIEGRTYTLCGTPEYLAPEILTNKGHGKGVDWWTLGVIIYEMIAGIDPFNDEDPMSIYKNILKGVVKFPFSFDSDAKSLVKHLLQSDLSKRYGNLSRGALDVKEHRFFAKINWSLIQDKKIEAPYKPEISSESDTSNFSSFSSAEDQIVPAVKPEMDPFLKWSS